MTTLQTIETPRLIIRPINQSDLQAVYDIFSSEDVTIPSGNKTATSLEQTQKLINTMMEEEGYGIIEKTSKRLIGTIGFVEYLENNHRAEIAYEMHPDFWGKGFGKEALSIFIEMMYETKTLNRIEAYVFPTNIGSIKILEHIGFVKEGYLREHAIKRGHYQDYVLYAMIKSDWTKKHHASA